MGAMRSIALVLLSAPALLSQTKLERVNGREAYVLENGLIRVAALRGGGHLAEIRLISSDPKKNINPMRVPHYPTIDPHTYDPTSHDAVYGDSPHRWLSSGYMGHLLCFPFYGPPSSEEEVKAGLGNHGEAPIVEWKRTRDEVGALWYGADLPKTQYRVERRITLAAGSRQVRVEEWVENLANYDRPFQWMQHATFGPPFVEPGRNFLDASVTQGRTAEFGPMTSKPNSGGYTALLADPSRKQQFFTLYHTGYKVLVGYVYPSEGNPWLADWQENQRNTVLPWNGKVIARGIEFGNSPYAEGLRKAIERKSHFGVPSYGWIGARQRLKNEFTVFLEEIPESFSGVTDARIEGGKVVVDRR